MKSMLTLSNFSNPQRISTTMRRVTVLLVLVCAVAILAHPSDDAHRHEGEHNGLDCGCDHENHQEHGSEERSVHKREADFVEHDEGAAL
ncbi:hypothetical protein J437_LFUL013224 [Ladona fulva]|uniref:Secreted protein n=1 Tax=Ladona fulva TaxID=123851 RepID=A0A8K0KFW1_LADFU|nr:hypothetical protein J437_LFUL013224 [Ladona fulva]